MVENKIIVCFVSSKTVVNNTEESSFQTIVCPNRDVFFPTSGCKIGSLRVHSRLKINQPDKMKTSEKMYLVNVSQCYFLQSY